MRPRIFLSLLLPTAFACSGSESTAPKPEFATGCTILPTLTAPAPVSVPKNTSSASRWFILKNNCPTLSSGPWDFTATRSGAVASVGTPSPSVIVALAGGTSAKILVPFTTGSTTGSGTVTLKATNDNLGPPPVSISKSHSITVTN